MRKTRSAIGLACAVLVAGGMALAVVPSASAAVEINSQSPVTAEPPVSRPNTHSCTQTLANEFPSNTANGTPQNFTGTLTPPADCPGPWAKVVMDWTTSVKGRQYDRSGWLTLGSTMVYFGTTQEPVPAGISYNVAKDITGYSALFHSPQPFSGGIGNYVDSVRDGVYIQTVSITFYQADPTNPAPVEADSVVGLGSRDASSTTPTVHVTATNLPRNITRAYLEVYIKGNGCDEQWFTDVPDDVAAKYPGVLCGKGPYREVGAAVDGTTAGVMQYFPYIYTGGIVPTLWRPIPAVGTFDMTPELLDITPFVGRLVDGGSHDVALSVANAGDVWNLSANLLLYTDHGAAQTSGALTTNTIAPTAVTNTTEKTNADGSLTATVTATRDWTTSGYVNTSTGRVDTSIVQHVDYRNTDVVSNGGWTQNVAQSDDGWTRIQTSQGQSPVQTTRHAWSYPITVYSTGQYTDYNNYNLSGAVDMTRRLVDTQDTGNGSPTHRESTNQVWSKAVLQRANGQVVQADGTEWQHYVGSNDNVGDTAGEAGGRYDHYLAAEHGYVTVDRLRTG